MNTSFSTRYLVCFAVLTAFSSFASADDKFIVSDNNKNVDKPATTEVKDAPEPLMPVPEPSAVSLILLSVGAVALVVKMRKRA